MATPTHMTDRTTLNEAKAACTVSPGNPPSTDAACDVTRGAGVPRCRIRSPRSRVVPTPTPPRPRLAWQRRTSPLVNYRRSSSTLKRMYLSITRPRFVLCIWLFRSDRQAWRLYIHTDYGAYDTRHWDLMTTHAFPKRRRKKNERTDWRWTCTTQHTNVRRSSEGCSRAFSSARPHIFRSVLQPAACSKEGSEQLARAPPPPPPPFGPPAGPRMANGWNANSCRDNDEVVVCPRMHCVHVLWLLFSLPLLLVRT